MSRWCSSATNPRDHVREKLGEAGQEEKAGRRSQTIPAAVFPHKKLLEPRASGRGQGQHLRLWSCRKRGDFPAHSLPRSGGEAELGEAPGAAGTGKSFPWVRGSSASSQSHPTALPDDLGGVFQQKPSWRSLSWLWDEPKIPRDIRGDTAGGAHPGVPYKESVDLLPKSCRAPAELELGFPGTQGG